MVSSCQVAVLQSSYPRSEIAEAVKGSKAVSTRPFDSGTRSGFSGIPHRPYCTAQGPPASTKAVPPHGSGEMQLSTRCMATCLAGPIKKPTIGESIEGSDPEPVARIFSEILSQLLPAALVSGGG